MDQDMQKRFDEEMKDPRRHKRGFPNRPPSDPAKIAVARRLLSENKLSLRQIGRVVGLSKSAIQRLSQGDLP